MSEEELEGGGSGLGLGVAGRCLAGYWCGMLAWCGMFDELAGCSTSGAGGAACMRGSVAQLLFGVSALALLAVAVVLVARAWIVPRLRARLFGPEWTRWTWVALGCAVSAAIPVGVLAEGLFG